MPTARSITQRRDRIRPKLAATANARTALADWGPGLTTSVLTFGQFSLFDAILAVLDRTGPAHVHHSRGQVRGGFHCAAFAYRVPTVAVACSTLSSHQHGRPRSASSQ